MLRMVRMYDYPKYVEDLKEFSHFLKREKDWHEDVLNFLSFLLKVESTIGYNLSTAQSGREYLTWCHTEAGVKLSSDAKEYALKCKAHYNNAYLDRLVDDLVEKIQYLLSDRCIQFYTEA